MDNNDLKVSYLPISSISPYDSNPRIHRSCQVQQIAESIKEFDFNNPILVDEKDVVIAGHGRLLAAEHLGMEKVPVIRLVHLSDARKRAYRIADNKLTENGQWDMCKIQLKTTHLIRLKMPHL